MGKNFILGHFGGFNTGDEAMLGGFLKSLPSGSNVLIKYKNEVDVDWGEHVNLFHGSYTDFVKPIGTEDTLVLCGGTHFHDDYSPVRLLRHWLYLLRINYLFVKAKRQGARTLCIGNGFGPVKHPVTKLLIKQFAGLCDAITVRDKSSLRVMDALGCKVNLVHPDLAMLLYNPHERVSKQDIVGVSLTSLSSQSERAVSDEELTKAVADELITFSKANNGNVLIRLFVIRSGERESDAPIMNLLHQRLQQSNVRSEIYAFNNDLNALIHQMQACQVLLASRFHSAVLGAVTQNRLIILSYHNKLVSFAEEVKMDKRFVVDLQRTDAVQQLAGLSKVISRLYTSNQLNYNFPEADIRQLDKQIRAIYEESVNIRVHANVRRAPQPGESAVPSTAGSGL
ncbi:polysaccharide pyruvyl transferase family protein [Fibrisoma limi]|uniref:polysaccharide pyruvyl transferase family protein n=1 Tax=Fibrisoma limi TaxID=663275 RepID=UPI0002F5D878|nr:polysaccharide pyruvyl transferase family protein [Fibrisoma limi]